MKTLMIAFAMLLATTACGGSDKPDATDASQTATATPTVEATTPATTEPPAIDSTLYPNGYPRVVKVSSLPDQVRSWYEMSHDKRAVAVAPGVWAEMQAGAEMQDALDADVLDGFCSSIKAYERKFLGGEDHAGTCW